MAAADLDTITSIEKKTPEGIKRGIKGELMTEYIKPGKAAELLGVSRDSIRRYVDSGAIAGITTPGGQRRIDRQSIDSLIDRRVKVSSTVTIIEGR
tara:strand:- start:251 stop:538 length:288 start_codon:yes stop_codon:yes gene_type:complete